MTFSSDRRLDEHLRSRHPDRIFECEMCSRVHDRTLLIDHMTGHADENQIEGDGSEIQDTPSIRVEKGEGGDLNNKENRSKVVARPFVCLLCGHSFGYNCALKQHVKSKHSALRGYQCQVCEKAFKTSSGLYNHRRLVHNPHFDFPCRECDQKFKLQHELQRHVRTVHERQMNYFCDQCPKGFFLQDSLTRHRRTHARELEFNCDQCLFRTTQRRYLICHVNRKHMKRGGKVGGRIQTESGGGD